MPETIDERPVIGSHTKTEFGIYDSEPFPVEGNAYYWYIRAVYWKREANRREGVQATLEFDSTSKQTVSGGIVLSAADMKTVMGYLTTKGPGGYVQTINAIKHVRGVTLCGLVQAKDFVDKLIKLPSIIEGTYTDI